MSPQKHFYVISTYYLDVKEPFKYIIYIITKSILYYILLIYFNVLIDTINYLSFYST